VHLVDDVRPLARVFPDIKALVSWPA
jgi:hypothetical protein